MCLASFSTLPSALVLATRSEPAKSTRFSLDLQNNSHTQCVNVHECRGGCCAGTGVCIYVCTYVHVPRCVHSSLLLMHDSSDLIQCDLYSSSTQRQMSGIDAKQLVNPLTYQLVRPASNLESLVYKWAGQTSSGQSFDQVTS